MSKTATVTVVAISTVMLRKKKYIHGLTTRSLDSKQLPSYTEHESKAHDFETREAAWDMIRQLVNNNDREFEVEVLKIPLSSRQISQGEIEV